MRATAVTIMMMVASAMTLAGRTLVSTSDGYWDEIAWSSGARPVAGDTLVIASLVLGMKGGPYASVTVAADGLLVLNVSPPSAGELIVEGRLRLDRGVVWRIDGDLAVTRAIEGSGVIEMTRDSASISGGGRLPLLDIRSGISLRLLDSLTVGRLQLGTGARLELAGNGLLVEGPYVCADLFGDGGIVGPGRATFGDAVEGGALCDVRIVDLPGVKRSQRRGAPGLSGSIGCATCDVTIAASRRAAFASLTGAITIDSGVVVEGSGIGVNAFNRITGRLHNVGTLRSRDPAYRWWIAGSLTNEGLVESTTITMGEMEDTLDARHGRWDPGLRLEYRGRSGGRLALLGDLALSRLTVVPRERGDTGAAVHSSLGTLRIRHDLLTDTVAMCRLIVERPLRLWGRASGLIVGDVRAEGFWGSRVDGRITGGLFDILVPTTIGRLVVDSLVHLRRAARLDVADLFDVHDSLLLEGRSSVEGLLLSRRQTSLRRPMGGRGALLLLGAEHMLACDSTLEDSLEVVVGNGLSPTRLRRHGLLRVPRLHQQLGSTIDYRAGDTIDAFLRYRRDMVHPAGFSVVSAAAHPADPTPATFFTGALSPIYRFTTTYVPTDSVRTGEGYYVRFPGDVITPHVGRFISLPLRIPLRAGWNLVGGASVPAEVSRVEVVGTSINGFLPASGSTTPVSILQPGVGYWVRADGAGEVVLHPSP